MTSASYVASRQITVTDEEWPDRLREIGSLEAITHLHLVGRRLDVAKSVAIVGARHPTAAGIEAAETFSRQFVQAGYAIVSGLALGIDAAAHRAALDAGGYTIAVLGYGMDVVYPARQETLKRRIAQDGTLATEFPPGTPPHARNFPQRNRIIAALCQGVLVVEGGAKSGALITARHALDANRNVYAIPGSIRNPLAAGPNSLVRTGQAALVTDPKHVFDDLAPSEIWGGAIDGRLDLPPDLDDLEARVLRFLDDVPLSPDHLCLKLELDPGKVGYTLSRLEIRGFVRRRSSGYELSQAGCRARQVLTAT